MVGGRSLATQVVGPSSSGQVQRTTAVVKPCIKSETVDSEGTVDSSYSLAEEDSNSSLESSVPSRNERDRVGFPG